MTIARQTRVNWITNLQAPYREPVWGALADMCDLEVCFLAKRHRERPWSYKRSNLYRSRVLRSVLLPSRNPDRALYTYLGLGQSVLRHADVVVLGGWESPAYWQLLLWGRRRQCGIVAFLEAGNGSSRFVDRHPIAVARSAFYRAADVVLCAGETSAALARGMAVPPARIVTTFNSVDVSEISRKARVFRQKHPTDGAGGHRFLYVGRLLPLKRVSDLMVSFREIAGANDSLLIVGDGPMSRELDKAIVGIPCRGRIERMSAVCPDRVFELMASANTLVLPSIRETWGMVVVEALAAGMHVVLTETVGAARSVQHMRGVYVAKDVGAPLSQAMAASCAEWRGPIERPEVLSQGPEHAAEDAFRAIRLALSNG